MTQFLWIEQLFIHRYGILTDQILPEDIQFARAQVHCDNKTRHIGRDHDYKMAFQFLPVDIDILHLKGA